MGQGRWFWAYPAEGRWVRKRAVWEIILRVRRTHIPIEFLF